MAVSAPNSSAVQRVRFLGSPVDRLTVSETLEWMAAAAKDRIPRQAVVVNANKFYMMKANQALRDVVNSADLVVPEWAVVWGAKQLRLPPVPHSGGLLIAREFMPFAEQRGLRPFLLGAAPNVVTQLVDQLRHQLVLVAWVGSFVPSTLACILPGFTTGTSPRQRLKNTLSSRSASLAQTLCS